MFGLRITLVFSFESNNYIKYKYNTKLMTKTIFLSQI